MIDFLLQICKKMYCNLTHEFALFRLDIPPPIFEKLTTKKIKIKKNDSGGRVAPQSSAQLLSTQLIPKFFIDIPDEKLKKINTLNVS